MSCDHQLMAEQVCDYIEGNLPPSLKSRCDAALDRCGHCREVYAQALEFYQLSSRWQDHPVPEWNRTRFAVQPPRLPTPWLSLASLAASCLAVLMVVLQLEISTGNGLLISFGGSQTEARVQAQVVRELAAWQEARDLEIDTRLADFAEDQATLNQVVLAQWMERGRAERRQDLSFVLSAWESQRFQDQRRMDERLDYLATSQIESNQYLNELLQTVEYPQRGDL